jgi:hypothetical protein
MADLVVGSITNSHSQPALFSTIDAVQGSRERPIRATGPMWTPVAPHARRAQRGAGFVSRHSHRFVLRSRQNGRHAALWDVRLPPATGPDPSADEDSAAVWSPLGPPRAAARRYIPTTWFPGCGDAWLKPNVSSLEVPRRRKRRGTERGTKMGHFVFAASHSLKLASVLALVMAFSVLAPVHPAGAASSAEPTVDATELRISCLGVPFGGTYCWLEW